MGSAGPNNPVAPSVVGGEPQVVKCDESDLQLGGKSHAKTPIHAASNDGIHAALKTSGMRLSKAYSGVGIV